ncbi:DUF3987 domain-containing protein [Methylomonas sp. MS20]|uniref:DUF3987 domain-containing protein n=1 Tax=unclassified Methylomonas TaxID=2608980 RepID=UPI0028A53138|nr:DUF3987 domain-containing protein [Methylomonas sp. MV1]MDT4331188.1 DUF3987 domain-containing protein [Methylomonas sp. MV1]
MTIQLPKNYRNKPLVFGWTYRDTNGQALGAVGRYQAEGAKKDVVPFFKRRGADWMPGIDADPRPLFGLDRLAAHDKTKAVFIVEGEPCAAALQSIGLCAVTSLGGSQAARKADWTPLNGFGAVYILPDIDEPGEKYAAEVAECLAALPQPPKVKIVCLPNLEKGGDVVDWLEGWVTGWDRFGPIDGALHESLQAKLREVIASQATRTPAGNPDTATLGTWANPGEIRPKIPAVLPMAPELIPSAFRDWLADVSHRMQTPADFPVISTIVIFSSVIGAGCGIRPKQRDGWEVIPNLWGACIGRPSVCLKSPSMKEALGILDRLQFVYGEMFEREKRSADFEGMVAGAVQKDLKSRLDKEAKKSTMDGRELDLLRAEYLEALEASEQQPTRRLFKTNETTIQSMTSLQAQNPRGLLVFRDELTGLLVKWDREDGADERAYFLEGWNGNGAYTDVKIARGVTEAKQICISLLGGIQPDKLKAYLHQAQQGGNDGMIQRLQLAVWPDEPKNWQLIDTAPNKEHKHRAFVILQKLAEMDFAEHGANFDREHDDRPYYRFDEAGQAVFFEWLTELQTGKIPTEENPLMVEHFGKFRSLMPSLALIFHLIDIANGAPGGPVTEAAARLAVAWCDYLESHARRIYAMAESPEQEAAVKLASKIKAGGLPNPFTTRDIDRKGWHGLGKGAPVKEALEILAYEGWIVEQPPEPQAVGRRPLPSFHINPLVLR